MVTVCSRLRRSQYLSSRRKSVSSRSSRPHLRAPYSLCVAAACRRKSFVDNTHREDEIVCSVTSPFKPASSAPSSPVKRRQSGCHYSDVESSPRKRRGISKRASCLEGERRLLFLDTTNSTSQIDSSNVFEPQPSTTSDRQSRVRTLSKEHSVKRPRASTVTRPGMWVEINKTT
jgi:NAD-dependent histone deacetylase SIR2